MVGRKKPLRGEFLPLCGKAITLSHIFPGKDGYFYTKSQRSSHGEIFDEIDLLNFAIEDLTTPMQVISTKTADTYHIKGMLKWLSAMVKSKNGSDYRLALLADVSGSIRLEIWRDKLFELSEDTVYLITNLVTRVQDLSTSSILSRFPNITFSHLAKEAIASGSARVSVKMKLLLLKQLHLQRKWLQKKKHCKLFVLQKIILKQNIKLCKFV